MDLDSLLIKLGEIVKSEYLRFLKGGVVLLGVVCFVYSDTVFRLVEIEAKANDLKFLVEISTGVEDINTLDCKKLVSIKDAKNCNSAQYYNDVLNPASELLNLVTKICIVLGLNMMMYYVVGLFFQSSRITLSRVLNSLIAILCVNLFFLIFTYFI